MPQLLIVRRLQCVIYVNWMDIVYEIHIELQFWHDLDLLNTLLLWFMTENYNMKKDNLLK